MRTLPADRRATLAVHRIACVALLIAGLSARLSCQAGSAFESAHPSGSPARATTHLDFRITVLPALALQITPERVRVEANSGAISMQHELASGSTDGQRPGRSAQLQSHREIVVHEFHPAPGRAEILTVASP